MVTAGLEPATSILSGWQSNLLIYATNSVTLPYFILTSDHIRTVSQNGVALVLGAAVYKLFKLGNILNYVALPPELQGVYTPRLDSNQRHTDYKSFLNFAVSFLGRACWIRTNDPLLVRKVL